MTGDLKRNFGLRVRELREAKSMTQEQLAEAIGRSVDTIGGIERGVNATRIETAQALAIELGVTLPSLFEFGTHEAPPPSGRDRAVAALLHLLADADAVTVEKATELLRLGFALPQRT